MKWCRVLIFLSYVHLTRSSKISRQGKNRRHGCYKRQGTAVEWMSPWSDWKVRQGRAYSAPSLRPAAVGRATELCPALSDFPVTPRRHNQSPIQNGTRVKKINLPYTQTPFNHYAEGKPYSSGRSWTELREHSTAWRKNKESAENLATSLV